MANNDQNATGPNNFYVRLKPRVARWLRNQVSEDATSVPAVIRDVLDKEYILEKARHRRAKRSRVKRKP